MPFRSYVRISAWHLGHEIDISPCCIGIAQCATEGYETSTGGADSDAMGKARLNADRRGRAGACRRPDLRPSRPCQGLTPAIPLTGRGPATRCRATVFHRHYASIHSACSMNDHSGHGEPPRTTPRTSHRTQRPATSGRTSLPRCALPAVPPTNDERMSGSTASHYTGVQSGGSTATTTSGRLPTLNHGMHKTVASSMKTDTDPSRAGIPFGS